MKKILWALVAGSMLCSTASAQNLIAHYAMDEAAGATTAADSATLGAQAATPGAINGAITAGVPGVFGTGFEFAGGFIQLQADGLVASDVNPVGPFTLAVWVKPNSATVTNTMIYTTQNGNAATGAGWCLKVQDGLRYFLDTAQADAALPMMPYTVDQWSLAWLTYDGNTALCGSIPLGTGAVAPIDIAIKGRNDAVGGAVDLSTFPVRIGASQAGTFQFRGFLDDVRLYDDALTTAQLANLFNAAVPAQTNIAPSSKMLGFDKVNPILAEAPSNASLTITNNGSAPLNFVAQGSETHPGLVLSGSPRFTITSVTPATTAPLAAGASLQVQLQFAPQSGDYILAGDDLVNTLEGMLTVHTNDPDQAALEIALSGITVPVELSTFSIE